MNELKSLSKPECRKPKSERDPKTEVRSPKGRTCYGLGSGAGNGELLWLRDGSGENNLLERTARFGEAIVCLCKRAPRNPVNDRLLGQLVGCGTSIGANYCEADDAVSGKDFKLRIGTARKESKECMFFLRMLAAAEPALSDEARKLWREAKELNLIFGAMWRK